MKKGRKLVLVLIVLVCAVSAVFANGAAEEPIIILYTNDVHCGYADNCGYTGVAALKNMYEAKYGKDNVTLVDVGDAIQGSAIGTVSNGEYIVDIMNKVGYDFAVFGNHEFDYNLTRLQERVNQSNATYLNASIVFTGSDAKENKLAATKPYEIVSYGMTKVAFIGVSTPESIIKSTPKYFMDANGNYIYEFKAEDALYATVQSYVDEVKELGADYVVVLSHLGIEEDSAPNRSTDLIANTTGIDILLDAHSHSVVEGQWIANKDGFEVLYSQTGTKLENIGVLTIAPGKYFRTQLVKTDARDAEVDAFIAAIDAEYKSALQKVVAHSEVQLSITDENGARVVRNREAVIGDLCADAYKAVSGADVAFVNGGGIRATIKAGDITTENMMAVHPYGNMLCMCEATGQEILDALEHGSKNTTAVAAVGKNAQGESGGFLQVSGLKYTIDTSIASTVVTDAKGMFQYVAGERRVKDVFVGSEETGWTAIDPDKTYTLACHNYKLQDMGDGYTMFADNKFLIDKAMLDNQVVITYIVDFLDGNVSEADYGQVKGRITVK